jgi:LBP / BPI / CETP family, C-terminal domain/LBP / BPI / CETP family, N-terminal domain
MNRIAIVLAVLAVFVFAANASSSPSPHHVHHRVKPRFPDAVAVKPLFMPTSSNIVDAGLRFSFLQSGLTVLADGILLAVNSLFQDVSLPNMTIEEKVPIIGHITLELENIKISGVMLHKVDFDLNPASNELDLAFSNLELKVSMDFKWHDHGIIPISDHGSVEITVSDGNIDADVLLQMLAERIHAVVESDSCSLGDFDIKFHAGWVTWLYDLLKDLFKNTIKKDVAKAVQTQLTKIVDTTLNQGFDKLPLTEYFAKGKEAINVDVGITNVTVHKDASNMSFVSFGSEFAVSNNATGAKCPLSPVPLPYVLPANEDFMVQIMLDDRFFNCWLNVITVNGAVNSTITNSQIPSASPINLNTSTWQSYVPMLYEKFPNQLMTADITILPTPNVTTSPSTGVVANMQLAVAFAVNGTIPVFELALDLDFGLDFRLAKNGTLYINSTALSLQVVVINSNVGSINVGSINGLLQMLAPVLQELINDSLKFGIPLPIGKLLQFVQPAFAFQPGYVAIGVNFELLMQDMLKDAAAVRGKCNCWIDPCPCTPPMPFVQL